jgi:hypothetical protein
MLMKFILTLSLGTLGLFLLILTCVEIGRRFGKAKFGNEVGELTGYVQIEGALFAILGLLVAFTFYGAASRFDMRRIQIIDEANAIGTAYLRLGILPASAQPEIKALFRQYVDLRLTIYKHWSDYDQRARDLRATADLQKAIWDRTLRAIPRDDSPARVLLLPAQNEMFDIANKRMMMIHLHPPTAIYLLMLMIAMLCSLVAGIGVSRSPHKSWLHIAAFALVLACTIYVILDLEYPRFGLIRIESMDHAMTSLAESLSAS